MKSHRKGFTLVELIIGVGIVAVLAGVAVGGFGYIRERVREADCLNNMSVVIRADAVYREQHPGAGEADYEKTVARLIAAGLLEKAPVCRDGGVYSFSVDEETGERVLMCSVHDAALVSPMETNRTALSSYLAQVLGEVKNTRFGKSNYDVKTWNGLLENLLQDGDMYATEHAEGTNAWGLSNPVSGNESIFNYYGSMDELAKNKYYAKYMPPVILITNYKAFDPNEIEKFPNEIEHVVGAVVYYQAGNNSPIQSYYVNEDGTISDVVTYDTAELIAAVATTSDGKKDK